MRTRISIAGLEAGSLVILAGLSFVATGILAPPATGGPGQDPAARMRLAGILRDEDRRFASPELKAALSDADPAIRGRAALALGRIGRREDAGAVASLLRDSDPGVRVEAAFAAGLIADSSTAAAIAGVVREDNDPGARAAAVEALGKVRKEPEACASALDDPDPSVVTAALLAAWRIPVPGLLEPALRLSESTDPRVRAAAGYALMRLAGAPASGRTPIPAALPLSVAERERTGARLRALCADTDPELRACAARGLGSFADSATSDVLWSLLLDPDWRVRVEAIRALCAPVPPGAGGDGSPAARVSTPVLSSVLRDENPNVRVTGIEAMGGIPLSPAGMSVLESTMGAGSLPRIREAAILSWLSALRAGGDSLAPASAARVDSLGRSLLAEKDWPMRVLAADCAAALPPGAAIPILKHMLRDEPRVAKAAIEPFFNLQARAGTTPGHPPIATPVWDRLQPQLGSLTAAPDPVVRTIALGAAAAALADTNVTVSEADRVAFESLLARVRERSLRQDKTGDVRYAVVESARLLVESAGAESAGARSAQATPARSASVALLAASLEDPNYLVRRAAHAALKALRIPWNSGWPQEPEPVETGRSLEDYAAVLDWAAQPHWAVIRTGGREIVVRLFSSDAPLTCRNFADLAGSGFFDRKGRGRWHRVVPDFVLQDGCPRGDGYGGADHEIRCEINPHRYLTGTLGMALSGKDTGSSQFFLTHTPQPHLDGRYTVFGQIERGQEIADRVQQGDPILSIRVVDKRP